MTNADHLADDARSIAGQADHSGDTDKMSRAIHMRLDHLFRDYEQDELQSRLKLAVLAYRLERVQHGAP